jgi:hypothetical protein
LCTSEGTPFLFVCSVYVYLNILSPMPKKKKRPEGRPTKYHPIYCQKMLEYFGVNPCNFKDISITKADGTSIDKTEEEAALLPTFMRFARSIGVWSDTLLDWCKKNPEFSLAYIRCKELQQEFIIENALRDNYSGYFAGLMMKNMHGWRDKTETEHSGKVTVEETNAIVERIAALARGRS